MPLPRKLTDEQAYEIRRRYIPRNATNSRVALAKEYGVTPDLIGLVVQGLTYKTAGVPAYTHPPPPSMLTPSVMAFVKEWYIPWHKERGLKAFSRALHVCPDTLRDMLRKTPEATK